MFCWKSSRLIDYYYPRFSIFGSFLSFLLVHFFDKQASSSTQTRIYILQNSKKLEMKRKETKNKGTIYRYRVSHSGMVFFKWLWGVERLRIFIIYLWLHGLEGYPFVFHPPVFKKVALASLNSHWQKRC